MALHSHYNHFFQLRVPCLSFLSLQDWQIDSYWSFHTYLVSSKCFNPQGVRKFLTYFTIPLVFTFNQAYESTVQSMGNFFDYSQTRMINFDFWELSHMVTNVSSYEAFIIVLNLCLFIKKACIWNVILWLMFSFDKKLQVIATQCFLLLLCLCLKLQEGRAML